MPRRAAPTPDVIGEKANATRPEIEQIMIGHAKAWTRRVRARALSHPPADREGGDRGEHQRLLHLLAVVPLADLQGHVPRRAARGLLSRPAATSASSSRFAIYPPALFDQHLPAVAAGPAVPHAGPQRRDQHAEGQRQLDEEPRDPHGRPSLRRPAARTSSRSCSRAASDSAALDNVFEVLVRAGRDAPMAKTMLIPEAWSKRATDDAAGLARACTPTATR